MAAVRRDAAADRASGWRVSPARIVLGVLAVGFLRAPPAFAHAFLDHAEPRVGSTANPSLAAVTLTFTEPVEPAFCRVELLDASGKRVETGAPEHPKPDVLRVTIPPLAAGSYKVHWAVVSVDTHPTEGTFAFSVKNP